MTARLAAICIYPIKSCAANELDSAQVEPRGLAEDRRWMLVDANGRFLTGRQLPQLVRVRATPLHANRLRVEAPGMSAIEISLTAGMSRISATVWDSSVSAADAGPEAARWFSDYLGRPVRLVHADAAMRRPLDPAYGSPGDEVGFADGFPLLLLSRAAAGELSARAGRELGWRRFRPNLLVEGVTAHAEDSWRKVRIGELEFDVVKPCVRCVFTTIDPDTGLAEPDGQPLTTLKSYRRGAKGITFGQNLIARTRGAIRVGDRVQVLSLQD